MSVTQDPSRVEIEIYLQIPSSLNPQICLYPLLLPLFYHSSLSLPPAATSAHPPGVITPLPFIYHLHLWTKHGFTTCTENVHRIYVLIQRSK